MEQRSCGSQCLDLRMKGCQMPDERLLDACFLLWRAHDQKHGQDLTLVSPDARLDVVMVVGKALLDLGQTIQMWNPFKPETEGTPATGDSAFAQSVWMLQAPGLAGKGV